MTAPRALVRVGNVETTATIVTGSEPPPPTAAVMVSPTLRLFADRNAWVAIPGIAAAARCAGTVRSSSPRTGVVEFSREPAAAAPKPRLNVVVHAAPAAGRDEMTAGDATAPASPPKAVPRETSSGDEAAAVQPDAACPVAELTDRRENVAGNLMRVTGSW